MKITEIKKDRHYLVSRTEPNEKWPEDWSKACGLTPTRKVSDLHMSGSAFHVHFEPHREMIIKWANSLPNRMAIIKFWEWLGKKCDADKLDCYVDELNIEKLLDEYHEIDRAKLDEERRSLLE